MVYMEHGLSQTCQEQHNKVHGSPLQVGSPSELRLSNRCQELSCDSGFGFDEFDSTPRLAEDVFDVTSSVPQPPHGGVTVRSAKFRSCNEWFSPWFAQSLSLLTGRFGPLKAVEL